MKIRNVFARQVFDSRGIPTIEAQVHSSKGVFSAIVPSGTSAGKHEALELRDNLKEFSGKSVHKAVANVNKKIGPKISGKKLQSQKELDDFLIELDGKPNKSNLGANALLSVSMASARAFAAENQMQLFEFIQLISGTKKPVLPLLQMVLISGGVHADKSTDLQEFMILPKGFKSFSQNLRAGIETYHCLEKILKAKGMHSNVGKEGSFAPTVEKNTQALELILAAIEQAGYLPEKEISLALDCAATEFFYKKKYELKTENKKLSGQDLAGYYAELISSYPIASIEDPFAEDDFESFAEFTKKFGNDLQIVGDDLLVTNSFRIKKAIELKACNALLLKPNQIGTVTESIQAAKLSFAHDWKVIVSHRSGDTEDTFIADLTVGLACGQIKTGAPARSERTAKYNQLLRIEEKIR